MNMHYMGGLSGGFSVSSTSITACLGNDKNAAYHPSLYVHSKY